MPSLRRFAARLFAPTTPVRRWRMLCLELLETREVPTVLGQLRITDYNILNLPDTAAMTTVLTEIGNQTVAGLTRPIDVLLLQEINNQAGQTQTVLNILNGIYGSGTYARGVEDHPQSGGDRQGIIYRVSTVNLLDEDFVSGTTGPRAPSRYHLSADLDPTRTFYVYNSHYDSTDVPDRLSEAQGIRANADALGAGVEILYVGDYNIDTSSEDMYDVTLLGAGNGQAFDPINTPGNWTANSGFKSVHTQSTRTADLGDGGATGGMDDRFDFMLHSQEVGASGTTSNGVGLEYRPGSYRTFGNDNTHAFNGAITSGAGIYSSTVRTALMNASDHLPIVADYDIVVPDGDTTPPTLSSIDDGDADNLVPANAAMTYTVTFNEDILNGSFTSADLNNAGSASLNFGTINETSPGVFSVQVTPTNAGTIVLRIHSSAVVEDVAGNDLLVPVQDNDSVAVDATLPTATIADNVSGGPVTVGAVVTYTLQFSEVVTGVESGDLSNIGTAAGSFGGFTAVDGDTYTVQFTTTGSGTLIARINNAGAIIKDVSGNAFATPAPDDTTITVNAPAANGTLAFSSATYNTAEGQGIATITVTRTAGSTGTVGVTYATSNGSATQPGDYATATGSLSWVNGDSASKTFTVAIVDDGSGEASESFTVTLNTPTGGATLGLSSATVTIADPLLIVTGNQPSNSGTVVTFNRAFDTTVLNLYDNFAGTLGAVDVTLIGASVGAVAGSLVVNSANQFTFIKTSTVLAADNYTLTLRSSASNGIRDKAAIALDGDANGSAGGNYTVSFTAAPDSRVVSLPNVTRGAGQSVNVPATATGLPLKISNGTSVTGIVLDLAFDPSLLAISSVAVGSGVPGGSSANLTVLGTGLVRITFSSPSALGSGSFDFAILTATVPDAAPYASKAILDIRNLSINSGALIASDDDAIHLAAYLGDATGNLLLSGGDASLVSQVLTGLGTGFLAFQNADPMLIGDASGNGILSGGDASLISQKSVGLTVPAIPNIPGSVTPPAGGPDPRLYLVGGSIRPGETATVQVRMEVTDRAGIELASGDYAIRFDASRFEASNVRTGSLLGGFATVANIDNANGTIRMTQFKATSMPFAYGVDGDVILFNLTPRADARPGSSALNLTQKITSNGNTTWTGLYNSHGPLTLSPAPTDAGNDKGVDAIVVLMVRSTHSEKIGNVAPPATIVEIQPPNDVSTLRAVRLDVARKSCPDRLVTLPRSVAPSGTAAFAAKASKGDTIDDVTSVRLDVKSSGSHR